MGRSVNRFAVGPRARAWALGFLVVLACAAWCGTSVAYAAVTGKIQGKIVGTDTGEPIGFADVLLIPADTTMHKVGGLTNADGTFLLEAAPGRYTLQIRALSYATEARRGNRHRGGHSSCPSTPRSRPRRSNSRRSWSRPRPGRTPTASLLTARKKAAAVGRRGQRRAGAQVARQGRRRGAAARHRALGVGREVRVRARTGRALQLDRGGRRADREPRAEQAGRARSTCVPANLLDNIVVQKTYTADRPGEFGGGDVQVHTKDFPGARTWSFSIQQGYDENVTFQDAPDLRTRPRADIFGFGSASRQIPDEVHDVSASRPLNDSNNPNLGFPKSTLAEVARSFDNVWSSYGGAHDAQCYATRRRYGERVTRCSAGRWALILSGSFNRTMTRRDESQRLLPGGRHHHRLRGHRARRVGPARRDLRAQLPALPSHTLHLRGFYTNGADDEVRTYEDRITTGSTPPPGNGWSTAASRLMYVQRDILSGALEGQHEFPNAPGTGFDWKLTALAGAAPAARPSRVHVQTVISLLRPEQQPGGVLGARRIGRREYGDLKDNGWVAPGAARCPTGSAGSARAS